MATTPLPAPSDAGGRLRAGPTVVAVAALLALLAAVAALLPPQFDEVTYYLPALASVRAHPSPALREVPFPGPPAALWAQAALWDALGRGTFAARLFSLLTWAALASLPLWRPAREGPLGTVHGYASTLAFPFVLFAAAFSKHHVLVLLLLLVAVTAHANARRGRPGLVAASIAACVLAAGSSQLAGPLCLVLAIDAVARRSRGVPTLARLAGPLLGLATLAAFVIAWGAPSSPAFVDVPAFGERAAATAEAGLRWRPQQLAVGLLMLGVWVPPWSGVSRRGLWLAAACLLPAVGLAAASGVLAETSVPSTSARGPVCTTLRAIATAGAPYLGYALFGALAALGAAGVVDRALRGRAGRLAAAYVVAYLATMMAVPFVFESYYALMVVPACHLLGAPAPARAADLGRRALRWCVPASGVVYLAYKAAQAALAR